jgi:hypothetical protein
MNAYGIALACLAAISFVQGQVTMNPLTSFGGDGWVAPLELSWLGTGATERSIAFNGVTNHLLVASRNGGISIRVLDAVTGQGNQQPGYHGRQRGSFCAQCDWRGCGRRDLCLQPRQSDRRLRTIQGLSLAG